MVGTKHILALALVSGMIFLASCGAGENNPGRTYAPDMFYSKAVETYVASEVTENGTSAILPPENTVAYGNQPTASPDPSFLPFPVPKDTAGYSNRMYNIANPVASTADNMVEGKRLYGIYCSMCHGVEGNGKGSLVVSEVYKAAPPSYFADNLMAESEAYLFHVTQYGKGAMGSYAGQMSKEQRWKVIAYVRQMQDNYRAEQAAANEASATADATTNETLN